MKKTVFLLVALGTLVFSCTAKKFVSVAPADKELTAGKKRWTELTAQDLQKGHAIYTGKCNACHNLFDPAGFSEKKWEHEIDDMAPKAKLTAEEKESLRKYILSAMDAGKK